MSVVCVPHGAWGWMAVGPGAGRYMLPPEDFFQVGYIVTIVCADIADILCVARAFHGEPSAVSHLLQRLLYRWHVYVWVVAQGDAVGVGDMYLADAACAEGSQLVAYELC